MTGETVAFALNEGERGSASGDTAVLGSSLVRTW